MDFEQLTDENFPLYVTQHYESTSCFGVEDFEKDLEKLVYIKRLLRKYHNHGDANLRLLLNHIIIINNLFEPYVSNRILFFYMDDYTHYIVKTVLYFLNILQENVPEVNISEIELDEYLFEKLEEL